MCDYWPNDCNLAVVLWWHAAHCDAAHAFINSAREQGGVCFVHCIAGRNRSVALCAAHVRTHAPNTRQAWMNFQAVRILGSFVDWMLQMMRFDMHGKRCFLKMRRRNACMRAADLGRHESAARNHDCRRLQTTVSLKRGVSAASETASHFFCVSLCLSICKKRFRNGRLNCCLLLVCYSLRGSHGSPGRCARPFAQQHR
jgi:hypothetical protein